MAKTQAELFEFMRANGLAVIATASPRGAAEAALLDIAVTPELEIIFETTDATRKFRNLKDNPRVALVVGWDNDQTLQYEGLVDEPLGREQERITAHYFSVFPQKLSHRNWPGNHYFRVRPAWIRFSNYNSPRTVEEHQFALPDEGKAEARDSFFARLKNVFAPRS